MDVSNFLHVKLTFREKTKVAKLDRREAKSFSSLENLKKLICKHFPEINDALNASPSSSSKSWRKVVSGAKKVLNVRLERDFGGFTTVESDGDLQNALNLQNRTLNFQVDVVDSTTNTVTNSGGAFDASRKFSERLSEYSSASNLKDNRRPAHHANSLSKSREGGQDECRNFKRGHCRDGPTCRFSHDIKPSVILGERMERRSIQDAHTVVANASTASSDSKAAEPFKNMRELDYWLANQHGLVAAENIEQLSRDKGIQVLCNVVEHKNLPDDTITQFVKLLVKEGIRSSLLREKTNKIYGSLLGSSFLLQLHAHIATKFGIVSSPLPANVKPYLLLIEELQSRTADGWKEVPLDALHFVVLKLEESAGKTELMEIVSRLIDQREKLQRKLATAPPDKSLRGAEFRLIPIVPGKDELMSSQARQDLPVNRVGIQYSQMSDYLETHFQLLREDCIDPLRQGIMAYRRNARNNPEATTAPQQLRIYTEVRLIAIRCGDDGVEYVLSFRLPPNADAAHWESSKRLMFGALLCISSDAFQTFFWGVVCHRDVKELAKGQVAIRIIAESELNVTRDMKSGETSALETYVMVESAAAYFEAYYHVLKTLVREEMEDLPFTQYLLHLESKVNPPSYLAPREHADEYNFASVFEDIEARMGRSSLHILDEWPPVWAGSLDRAQQDALKHGLTKEVAIIQGPPGTGKTFLGLLLVRVLLANLTRAKSEESSATRRRAAFKQQVLPNDERSHDLDGPILVICYTNHALDQFLEGIFEYERNIVRIGGRGKSEKLKDCNLQHLLKRQREERGVEGSHRRLFWEGRVDKDILEKKIHECIDRMGLKFVTSKLLEGVATWEQIQSLFSEYQAGDSRMSNEIVQVWLTEEWCRDPLSAHYFLAHPDTDTKSSQRTIEERESAEKPTRGNLKLLPQNPEGDGDGDEWAPARRRGGRRRPGRHAREPPAGRVVGGQPHVRDAAEGNENIDRQAPEEEIRELVHIVDAANVWQLNIEQRRTLHNYWLDEIRMQSRRELTELSEKYQQACKVVNEIENEIVLSLLRNANVIGMTTTAAARHFDLLRSLKSNIVIVEEAAEVLEGHILACLTSSVKHLILIGDHVQLRPSVAVYRLATEHKLDVSMFERLVRSGVQHVTLREQRRMRPEISKLVKSLYPKLKDHKSVSKYEAVVGLSSSVFFFDHKSEEEQSKDAASKFNVPEAKLVVELCLYLLNQGCYKLSDITILTMYSGQLQQIKTLLRDKISSRMRVRPIGKLIDDGSDAETDSLPRVSSVDDFQGEESDIVILSLVRSNTIVTDEGVGKIGFLRISNRICVALTRARKGFFIFGNAQLLSEKSDLWKEVTESLRKDGALGPRLELYCQNHPNTKTQISKVEHFKEVEDGGCSKPCEYQLECGHVCPRRCHPGSHDLVVCPKPCKKLYDDCLHQCKLRCHGPDDSCPPCEVIVRKLLPQCGHEKDMLCCKDVRQEVCSSVCPRTLRCGHQCRNLCGRTCTHECHELVDRTLPCGHSAKIFCHLDPVSYSCKELCKGVLPECNHECQGSCGDCKQGTQHIPCKSKCGRNLPCSHVCNDGCSLTCPPCKKKCQKRCVHSRCSSRCGDLCTPCREPCAWNCAHIKCEKLCHEICTRPPCNLPCPKTIRACGHPCIGLCGEPCPTKCRVCHPHTKDSVTLMTLEESEESDRFIQLEDCGHLFEVSGLDTWMETSYETGEGSEGSGPVHVAIKLKECPECKTPIWRTHRYSNKVKEKQAQVEEVKKKINGTEFLRVGNLLLDKRDYKGALSTFMKALHQNPGLMEAHFGTGRAFSAEGNKHSYEKALMHFSFIVDKSSFASELAGMIAKVRARGKTVGITQNIFGVSSTRARDSLAGQAIVQWASTLTETREFSDAIKLCDTVLRVGTEEGTRTLALNIKQSAEKGEVQLVVQAMAVEVGTHGHWYTCPNGHLYTIGECGGAMQKSKCPACNAEIGGGNHRLAEGNRHSNIDGSTRSAWPGGA